MALDVRRYQQAREKKTPDDVDISVSTFPGLITLCVGVFVIIVGVILIAAFGVPKDIGVNMKPLSGVTVLAFGLFLSGVGMIVALYLKRKSLARKRARKRRLKEQQQQQQQLEQLERERRRMEAAAGGCEQQQQQQQQQQQEGLYEPQQLCVPPSRGHHTKVQPTGELLYDNSTYLKCNGDVGYDQQMALTANTAVPTVYS